MNRFGKARRWIVSLIGILPLVFSLANVHPVLASGATADMSVTITANRHTVRLGQNVTFTVRATNLGPDPAPSVDVIHKLPAQLKIVSLTCDGPSPDGLFCEYSLIQPGQTVVSTLVATPDPTALPHKRHLVVNAVINFETTDVTDPHLKNNSDSVAVQWVGKFQ